MEPLNEMLETIIDKCGGLGKFQWLIVFIMFLCMISVAWSMLMMTFGGATPEWLCSFPNITTTHLKSPSINESIENIKTCHFERGQNDSISESCQRFMFSQEMNTVVSEWDLVCDKEWITSTITTIQMAGLLVSCLMAGHLADSIGRKPTFYLSLLILTISNLGAAFSVSWEMFAVLRFIIGIGCGINLTVCVFVIEFIPTKFRSYILALPKWPVCAAFYALVSWWLRDWAYLHFATAIATAPMLLGFFVVPESFRWLASHHKIEEVENIVNSIASVNGKAAPELDELKKYAKKDFSNEKHYTLMDVLRSGNLARYTCMLCFTWCSCGYTYYSISFGVQQLSGSLYLNMFLLSFVEIPSSLMAAYLNNRIGRRWTCFLLFMLGAVGGAAVGIVQVLDPADKGAIINGCALTAKLGVSASWSALITFTSETFPTVVRNIGFGSTNMMARIGAMTAPQLVQISKYTTGLSYFLCGGCMFISAFCCLLLPETNGRTLEDQLKKGKQRSVPIHTVKKDGVVTLSFNKYSMQ